METDRLEAFSDGVFAIAITLLVLNLVVPGTTATFVSGTQSLDTSEATFIHALWHEWPSYLAFGVSFATIGVIWINHSWMYGHICKVNRVVLFINLIALITVVVIPFTTAIMSSFLRSHAADHATQHAAARVYIASLLTMSLAFTLMWWYCFSRRAAFTDLPKPRNLVATLIVVTGPIVYGVAILVTMWNATLSLVLCLFLDVFYLCPVGTRPNT
jgi:uncharacterized membrane protein